MGRGVAVCGAGLLYRMKYVNISNQREKFQGVFRVFSIYKRNVIPSLNGKKQKNNIMQVIKMKVIYYKIGDKMSKIDEKLLIYQKFINLIYYSKNLLNKYPKSERFDLCSDIKNALYKELKNIIYAWKAYSNQEKLKYLREVDVNLIFLKSLITISYKSQYISQKNYMVWNNQISEIGKLLGSWIKTCQKV